MGFRMIFFEFARLFIDFQRKVLVFWWVFLNLVFNKPLALVFFYKKKLSKKFSWISIRQATNLFFLSFLRSAKGYCKDWRAIKTSKKNSKNFWFLYAPRKPFPMIAELKNLWKFFFVFWKIFQKKNFKK